MCSIRDQFYNKELLTCSDWVTCDSTTHTFDEASNTCLEKTPSKEVCDARNLFFERETTKCAQWNVCSETQVLDRKINECFERATPESCEFQDLFFNSTTQLCQPWRECAELLILDKSLNDCVEIETYLQLCKLQNKFFDRASVSC